MDVEAARRHQAALVAAHETPRRMTLAPGVQILWESQTTIDHEQAEMMWREEDAEIRASMRAGYEALRPSEALLSATLTIAGHDAGIARTATYAGIEQGLRIVARGVVMAARAVGPTSTAEAAPDVMRLVFDTAPDIDIADATLVIDHPYLQRRMALPAAVRQAPLG